MNLYFLSDVHLCPRRPRSTGWLLAFLRETRARPAPGQTLYILGDLFETWIGDDAPDREADRVMAALGECAAAGTDIHVMHGNRDFLLGDAYLRRYGCLPLADPTLIDVDGTRTLLMHGDTLCTDDLEYQALRGRVRTPEWRRQTLARPLAERRAMAAEYRARSTRSKAHKEEFIMDVNDQAVRVAMRTHGAERLIHGHTHRPGVHRLELDGRPVVRYVLGPWYEGPSVLRCADGDCGMLRP